MSECCDSGGNAVRWCATAEVFDVGTVKCSLFEVVFESNKDGRSAVVVVFD